MARKSRRQQEQQQTLSKNVNTLQTAAYCRLSVEDKELESINTQIMLVQEFIRSQPDMSLANTYVDNGVTGTKFDRPEWNRLMGDVRSGKIQCIVVKDLSRFGRDYLEAGYYIENIFPKLHVRFVAITDHFDSTRPEDMESISIPVKNMVNAMYAKDTSKKIRAVRQGIMEKGERLGNTPPLGYRYPEGGKNQLVVDEETAGIIRMIFYWTSIGIGKIEIAKRLTFLQVPSPRQWQRNRSNGTPMDPALPWIPSSLDRILINRAYCGDTVTGMTRTKMHKCRKMDERDWYVTMNTHEPIIDRAFFERVQETMESGKEVQRRKRKETEAVRQESDTPLRGMVVCGICGRVCAVERSTSSRNRGSTRSKIGMNLFRCTYHYNHNYKNRCQIPISMQEYKLRMVIMERIYDMIHMLTEKTKLMQNGKSSILSQKEWRLQKLNFQRQKVQERNDRLFEDYAEKVIDAEDYNFLKENYRDELANLEAQIIQTESEIRVAKRKLEQIQRFLDFAGKRENNLAFDERLVKQLVDKIEINENEQVTIHFKFDDELSNLFGEEEHND